MLLELFDSILADRASSTEIKAVIIEIQNKETYFKDEKEDETTESINNQQKNSNQNNLPIDWSDFLPASL